MAAKSYHLPNEVANISRCSMCHEYLSCGPIMGYNGSFICGRCGKGDQNALVQVDLEKIMAFFVFPCRYDTFGCTEQVLFNTNLQHERICRYRVVPCPSLLENPCNCSIFLPNLYTHCVEFHNNLITNDGVFQINVDQDMSCNLVMVKDNITVIIKYFYNSKSKCLQLDVASASVIEELLICYKTHILSELLEGVNINLPEKQCTVYESYTISTDSIKIEIDKYLGLFSNPSSLIFKISPFAAAAIPEGSKNKCQPLSSIALVNNLYVNDSDEEEESDQLIDITDMFCSKCNKLSYPLYYDPKSSQMKFCVECRVLFGRCSIEYFGSRKNLSDKPYPCQYKECLFFGKFRVLIKHMTHCQYAKFVCRIDGCEHVLSLNEPNIRINHLKTHATYCENPKQIMINLYPFNSDQLVKKYFTYIRNVFILFKVELEYTKTWNFYCCLPSGIEMEITFYCLPGCNGNYSKKFVGYCKVHFNPQVSPALQCCKDSCFPTAMIKINQI